MKLAAFVTTVAALGIAVTLAQGCGGFDQSKFTDETTGPSSGSSSNGGSGSTSSSSGSLIPSRDDGGGGGDGGDAGDPTQCATASEDARRVPVYMQIIVDGSGSMDGLDSSGVTFVDGGREDDPLAPARPSTPVGQTGKKWLALRGALLAFFADAATKADPNLAVGMLVFSSTSPKSTDTVDVPIGVVDSAHAADLIARLSPPTFPNGGTPLAAAMNGQLIILKGYVPAPPVQPGGKYVLVVMTDGVPSDSSQTCLQLASLSLTENPRILTFAVGVGDPTAAADVYDELFVGDLAEAGGTAPTGCNPSWSDADMSGTPCHFQVTPGAKTAQQIQAEFLAAIDKIRDTVTSCELALDFSSGNVDPTKVNVELTSGAGVKSQITQDPANGWTYDDPNAPKNVVFHGSSCDALKADLSAKVRIIIGCKTVVAPVPK